MPKRVVHPNKGGIDWINSPGCVVKFIYDDIEGLVEIMDYETTSQKLTIRYNNKLFKIFTSSLTDCRLGTVVGKWKRDYAYEVGTIIETNNSDIKILEQIKVEKRRQRGYRYKCQTCGYVGAKSEYKIMPTASPKDRRGCPVCSSRKVMIGHNDMWTTNPSIAQMLANPSDRYKYTQYSQKYVDWICSDCSYFVKDKMIDYVNKRGLTCPRCSDGLSYPEKFMFNVLDQLGVNFESQKVFKWSKDVDCTVDYLCGTKRYDFYIPSLECIIETHGEQHYKAIENGWKKLEEQQENDRLKEQLAKDNGVKYYIVIDCRKSEMEWIRDKIIQSELGMLLGDVIRIDYHRCHELSCKSRVRDVCDIWNKGIKSISDISRFLILDRVTVRKYLKIGVNLGWVGNDVIKILEENKKNPQKTQSKGVICLNDGKVYESLKEAERVTGVSSTTISLVCKGKQDTSGGHRWMYLDDYNNLSKQEQSKALLI